MRHQTRCRWCGQLVPAGTPLTAWRVKVGRAARQNGRSPWNYWARLLCRVCAPCTAMGGWERTTIAVVFARRGFWAVNPGVGP